MKKQEQERQLLLQQYQQIYIPVIKLFKCILSRCQDFKNLLLTKRAQFGQELNQVLFNDIKEPQLERLHNQFKNSSYCQQKQNSIQFCKYLIHYFGERASQEIKIIFGINFCIQYKECSCGFNQENCFFRKKFLDLLTSKQDTLKEEILETLGVQCDSCKQMKQMTLKLIQSPEVLIITFEAQHSQIQGETQSETQYNYNQIIENQPSNILIKGLKGIQILYYCKDHHKLEGEQIQLAEKIIKECQFQNQSKQHQCDEIYNQRNQQLQTNQNCQQNQNKTYKEQQNNILGIQNYGNTCYFNSVIQLLKYFFFQNKQFQNVICQNKKQEFPFISALKEVFLSKKQIKKEHISNLFSCLNDQKFQMDGKPRDCRQLLTTIFSQLKNSNQSSQIFESCFVTKLKHCVHKNNNIGMQSQENSEIIPFLLEIYNIQKSLIENINSYFQSENCQECFSQHVPEIFLKDSPEILMFSVNQSIENKYILLDRKIEFRSYYQQQEKIQYTLCAAIFGPHHNYIEVQYENVCYQIDDFYFKDISEINILGKVQVVCYKKV